MRAFNSAADVYLKVNELTSKLKVSSDTTSNGFFSKPKAEGKESKYAELQKVILLMNEVKNQRKVLNDTAGTT